MADIKPFVTCLENRCVTGIGAKPSPISGTVLSSVGKTQRVKEKYVSIKASMDQNRFSCTKVASGGDGYYIFFEEGWATAGGNLTCQAEMIVASGNFSGCTYKIYHVSGDTYRCVHIARPAGLDPDMYVTGMDDYAKAKKWREVLEVPTAGLIGGRCSEVYVVSQYYHNKGIETVRLQLDNQGLIVKHDVYTVAIP